MNCRIRRAVLCGLLLNVLPAVGAAWDLSRPPDYREFASLARSGKLGEAGRALGKQLAASWSPARQGREGSCADPVFARWVDLQQWIALLESDEAQLTARWVSRHLEVAEPKDSDGPIRVTLLPPGVAPARHEDAPGRRGAERLAADPAAMQQVLGTLVLQPFSPHEGPLLGRLDPEFVAATVSDPVFLERWSGSFSEDDFHPRVLLNLQSIRKSAPTDWQEFLSLALSVAVVMDQPAPEWWPHHQVSSKDVPRVNLQPAEIFASWVRAFREGRLRRDLRFMEVSELNYLVDAPLDHAEYDWVREHPSVAREDPARAFESIRYDKGREARNVFSWPWGPYSLASIREHGGICVDQAYFASICGKALGIPTILFTGQGKDGGHAWVGYLKDAHAWNLDVGRYGEQNYATGVALNPQNWAPVNDHDLEMLTRHLGNKGPQDAARRDLAMASLFRARGDSGNEGRALESALLTCPANPMVWDAREEWLLRSGASSSELRSHHEEAIRQFSRFRDLRAQHQEALARLALVSGDRGSAERFSEQIVNENRGGAGSRSDLSAGAAGALIGMRIDANDPDGAMQEYDRQVLLQAARGGGDFLYKVVTPFARYMIHHSRPDLARSVTKKAYDALKPTKGSQVDKDLRKLWIEAGGIGP